MPSYKDQTKKEIRRIQQIIRRLNAAGYIVDIDKPSTRHLSGTYQEYKKYHTLQLEKIKKKAYSIDFETGEISRKSKYREEADRKKRRATKPKNPRPPRQPKPRQPKQGKQLPAVPSMADTARQVIRNVMQELSQFSDDILIRNSIDILGSILCLEEACILRAAALIEEHAEDIKRYIGYLFQYTSRDASLYNEEDVAVETPNPGLALNQLFTSILVQARHAADM